MRKVFLLAIVVLLVICRIAGGTEKIMQVPSDPVSMSWRLLTEYGPLGIFLLYMIIRERERDRREHALRLREEEGRKAAEERFHSLDKELVDLVKSYSSVTSGVLSVLGEIRNNIKEQTVEIRQISLLRRKT